MANGGPGGGGHGGELARVLDRNISALVARRRAEERGQTRQDKVAERIGRFAGSMTFVWLHAILVAAWVAVNVGLVPGPRFDPDFVKLATAASVEAIFLTTFVLVMQNRMAALADRRAELDLQISLLAEHELTRLIRVVHAMARKLGVDESRDPALGEIERDIEPGEVLERLDRAESDDDGRGRPPI
jgi:uncharacterized membrane protein